jgi:hypothetical protein
MSATVNKERRRATEEYASQPKNNSRQHVLVIRYGKKTWSWV